MVDGIASPIDPAHDRTGLQRPVVTLMTKAIGAPKLCQG
jgi:hypothetical protein